MAIRATLAVVVCLGAMGCGDEPSSPPESARLATALATIPVMRGATIPRFTAHANDGSVPTGAPTPARAKLELDPAHEEFTYGVPDSMVAGDGAQGKTIGASRPKPISPSRTGA